MKPFDRVLVRVTPDWEWMPHIFSKEVGDVYFTIDGRCWQYCVPFEGNEHLIGSTDYPTEPEPKPEFQFGDKVEVSLLGDEWYEAVYLYRSIDHHIAVQEKCRITVWKYCRKADW